MAVELNTGADEPTFSFDLMNIFDKENVQMDEIDAGDIPDADLVDLVNRLTEGNPDS